MNFGDNLKKILDEKGISQRQFERHESAGRFGKVQIP